MFGGILIVYITYSHNTVQMRLNGLCLMFIFKTCSMVTIFHIMPDLWVVMLSGISEAVLRVTKNFSDLNKRKFIQTVMVVNLRELLTYFIEILKYNNRCSMEVLFLLGQLVRQ